MENKKNIPLIVALAIPILMIVLTAGSIYLPSLFVKPTSDFIYLIGGNYCYGKQYFVQGGRLAYAPAVNDHCRDAVPVRSRCSRFYQVCEPLLVSDRRRPRAQQAHLAEAVTEEEAVRSDYHQTPPVDDVGVVAVGHCHLAGTGGA